MGNSDGKLHHIKRAASLRITETIKKCKNLADNQCTADQQFILSYVFITHIKWDGKLSKIVLV